MEALSYCQLMERCLRAEKTSEARKQGLIRTHKMYQREKQRAEAAEKRIAELEQYKQDANTAELVAAGIITRIEG